MTLLLAFLGILSLEARGAEPAPSYYCEVHGALSGEVNGFYYIGQALGGDGELRCVSSAGLPEQKINVTLRIVGGDPAFDYTALKRLTFASGRIGPVPQPADVLSRRFFVSAGGLARGADSERAAALSLTRDPPDLGFAIQIEGEKAGGLTARLRGATATFETR